MKQTKLDYSAPQAETFVVRFEGMVCTSQWGATNKAGRTFVEDDEITLGLDLDD